MVRQSVERMGGTLDGFWFAFGEFDVVAIITMPDNVSAAALSMAVAAAGAFKSGKTTPLLTNTEGLEAMKRAAAAGYQPPSS
jgi:uncharacterized protein with GYD domain